MEEDVEMTGRLTLELKRLIQDNIEYFLSFDAVKVYYDNG